MYEYELGVISTDNDAWCCDNSTDMRRLVAMLNELTAQRNQMLAALQAFQKTAILEDNFYVNMTRFSPYEFITAEQKLQSEWQRTKDMIDAAVAAVTAVTKETRWTEERPGLHTTIVSDDLIPTLPGLHYC